MAQPKRVLYIAENALSSIQGGGIVAYAVLQGLPPDALLGFFDYRNVTPAPEYADRFTYLGTWRTPGLFHAINRLTIGQTVGFLHRVLTEQYIRKDFAFVQKKIEQENFAPEIVYFAGLSYRYLRLAVMAAEHYDLPMVLLNMDDWMTVERNAAGPNWGDRWYSRIVRELTKASARSLVSTSNSPRLAARLSAMTGFRHVAANNCCSDLMTHVTKTTAPRPSEIPVIAYAGAMNPHLQGETLKILASAISELNAEGTRVHLHIYTPWEFAPEANSISVPNAVYYKGHVGREQLADIYRQADFLVTTVTHRESNIPLFRHSLSTKLSEYLCAGKPIISMGHHDWHLHEYVQDHGCGFSIPIDENYSRATIKAKLRRILATSPAMLDTIGCRNRALWERSHDATVMARDTRRAVGMSPAIALAAGSSRARGVVWVGRLDEHSGRQWVPLAKLKTICRQLRDVFEHDGVDVIGENVRSYPALEALVTYCEEIGLIPTVVDDVAIEQVRDRWEPAGTRWSLGTSQRTVDTGVDKATNVFDQVAELRHETLTNSPVDRAINQLTVRVPESAAHKPVVWVYGSTVLGSDVIAAIDADPWLSGSVQIGGYLSSPRLCKADVLNGHTWTSVDMLAPDTADLIVVTSETSRLAIQEELSRAGLLDRAVPLFGMAGTSAECGYRRMPSGPGQTFVPGSTARDYATRELVARTLSLEGWAQSRGDLRTVQRADAA